MELFWRTPNTKLAAVFGALGFPLTPERDYDERSGRSSLEWKIGDQSAFALYQHLPPRAPLLEQWKKGEMEAADPLHPFLQGLSVEHNVELLRDAQNKGRRICLKGVRGSHATEYRDGEEASDMLFTRRVMQTEDISLVAALGTLGIPVIKIEGGGQQSRYTLPEFGHPLRLPDGTVSRYSSIHLSRRFTPPDDWTAEEKRRCAGDLHLEHDEPHHPVVFAYNVRRVHLQLLREIRRFQMRIHLRPPGTCRVAIIGEKPSGPLLDRVQKHFRIP